MRQQKIIWTLLGILLSVSVQAQEKKVLDLSRRKFTWLIEKKYDSLLSVLDDRLMYVHSSGWVQNHDEVINDLKSGKLVYKKITVKEAGVRIYSKSAIVNGLGTFEGATDGKDFSMDLRYTEVYIKKGTHWMLASRHANRMP
jgi:hypothetical protein